MRPNFYVLYPFVANFGGIERLIVDLSQWVESSGGVLSWVGFSNKIDFAEFGASSMCSISLQSRRSQFDEARVLKSWVKQARIESSRILVMEMRGALYAASALQPGYGLHIADSPRLLGRDVSKYSFSLRQSYPALQSGSSFSKRLIGEWVFRKTRKGIQNACCVMTMTQSNVDELSQAFGMPFQKIPPGVQLPANLIQRPAALGTRFLSVCRLESSKRIDKVLEAFAAMKRHDASLTIAGEGSQAEPLKSLAIELGILDRVNFVGRVSEAELECIYATHDIFVMPAIQGYGLPGIEALARGLALILHHDSGVSEFVSHIDKVCMIDDLDDSLVAAMDQLAATTIDFGSIPEVPLADSWAMQVARHCGWVELL